MGTLLEEEPAVTLAEGEKAGSAASGTGGQVGLVQMHPTEPPYPATQVGVAVPLPVVREEAVSKVVH